MKKFKRLLAVAAGIGAVMVLAACATAQTPSPTPAPGDNPSANPNPPRVEVKAPIDSVEVLIRESWPPQYAVKVTSGLPNGCAEFERITHTIDGDTIEIEVINTQPAPEAQVMCTEQYRQVTNTVELGTDFEKGKTFTVSVNDGNKVTFTGQGGPAVEPDEGYERTEVLAPVENVEILVMESFPVQYAVRITSGLPNGCAQFERIETNREGDTIEIEVINTEPAPGQLVACTMIYGFKENTVQLGTDFESGKTYTVRVNDEVETFVAQ